MSTTPPHSSGPLQGIKVVDICSTIAGPACARLLADFGADVIKIEPPDGDPVRQMGQHVGDVSLYAASILRNKRSIALDFDALCKEAQHQGDAEARRKCCDQGNVVFHGLPGVRPGQGPG